MCRGPALKAKIEENDCGVLKTIKSNACSHPDFVAFAFSHQAVRIERPGPHFDRTPWLD